MCSSDLVKAAAAIKARAAIVSLLVFMLLFFSPRFWFVLYCLIRTYSGELKARLDVVSVKLTKRFEDKVDFSLRMFSAGQGKTFRKY